MPIPDHNKPDPPGPELTSDPLDKYFQEHIETCAACREVTSDAGRDPSATLRNILSQSVLVELLSEPAYLEAVTKIQQMQGEEFALVVENSTILEAGSQIGHYKILEFIAQGGMGQVYRAEHVELHKSFAMKLLPKHREESTHAIDRFRREMKALGQFSHPHVVMATDGGEDLGRFYLVMEFVDGRNFTDLIQDLGPLPIADAAELIRQAALGVEAIHRQGMVHRDIKPSNLILSNDGIVKVLDLGLSRFSTTLIDEEDLTATGQILGTRRFMAPEQFETSQVDARADLYSLAASLESLLTGGLPLIEESNDSKHGTNKVQKSSVCRALSKRDDLPKELIEILSRFTARRPNDRPSSAKDLIEALQPFCAGYDLSSLVQRKMHSNEVVAGEIDSTDGEPRHSAQPRVRSQQRLMWGMFFTALAAVSMWFGFSNIERNIASSSDSPETQPQSKNTLKQVPSVSKVPQPPIEQLQERQIAEWVLEKGGEVVRHPHGKIQSVKEIPEEGPFRIRSISLIDRGVSNIDILPFQRLSMIDGLTLSNNSSLTDRGLIGLSKIKTLRWLYVGGTQITDQALVSYNELSKLETLGLGKTSISGAGLEVLSKQTRLREIQLNGTAISNSGLSHLKNFPNLIRLNLSSTNVSDAGLIQLVESAPRIKYLQLQLTKITDEGLLHLTNLKQLKELNLQQTSVTTQGVEALRHAIPDCHVKH
ncbi:protein kinase domain-containing protein [Thalassoglobus polymorphus]|uniref:Serine/threonine-protein kinase PknH n=1 Tax=Thalassoglobus polymorphus TaxID=2527994 RepID=A0A517QP02_9PLAN|nr:protein kinase [Thalassoglobus polymorphus]QDT33307.1 Serine/threonine-protein kinase PknH [Thalassoglobus polymorphus]